MNRCSPEKMREALMQVELLKRSGIEFIPVPVTSDRVREIIMAAIEESMKEMDEMIGSEG